MFVDQPVGVGWSLLGNETNVNSTYEASNDFYKFITDWFALAEFQNLKAYELYLIGESFGGSYIPVFAEQIIKNKATN